MRILLTRPSRQSARSAARLSALGHQPLLAPVVDIVALNPEIPTTGFDCVIATSSNALTLLGARPTALARYPIFVVGEKTARAALANGWPSIEQIAPNAEQLTAAVLDQDPEVKWLYLAGSPRTPTLEQALDQAGRQITPVLVYEARPVAAMPILAAAALRGGSVDAILHYSERSAAAFVSLARRAGLANQAAATLHIAISRRAALPLRGFSDNVKIAQRPDEDGLFKELFK